MKIRQPLALSAAVFWVLSSGAVPSAGAEPSGGSSGTGAGSQAYGTVVRDPAHAHMHRARIYLAAGDYRRAIDACLQAVGEAPSAETYTYLTYAYHALNGYIEHLAKHDRWVAVEQLARSLLYRGPGDLTDPPEVLARIAKELMQQSVQQQADITAAMANRLGKDLVDRLWTQQSAWRAAHPEEWFYGAPPEWGW